MCRERGNDIVFLYADASNSLHYDGHTKDGHEAGSIEGWECGVCRADYTHATLPQSMAESKIQINPGKIKKEKVSQRA